VIINPVDPLVATPVGADVPELPVMGAGMVTVNGAVDGCRRKMIMSYLRKVEMSY
jgi:hypothetical protein